MGNTVLSLIRLPQFIKAEFVVPNNSEITNDNCEVLITVPFLLRIKQYKKHSCHNNLTWITILFYNKTAFAQYIHPLNAFSFRGMNSAVVKYLSVDASFGNFTTKRNTTLAISRFSPVT